MRTKTPLIGPDPQGFNELCKTLADLDPDEIYAAGLKEGRRRERKALRRWLDALWLNSDTVNIFEVKDRLAAHRRNGGKK